MHAICLVLMRRVHIVVNLKYRFITRTYTSQPSLNIFNRNLKRLHRDKASKLPDNHLYNYLKENAGLDIIDRLCDIKRNHNILLDLGCGTGFISKHLNRGMVSTIIQCDMSSDCLSISEISKDIPTSKVTVDDEHLPFKTTLFDVVVSSLNLHWVNDLPRCFAQVRDCLVDDGVFIGSMFCEDTLFELRSSLQMAELQNESGFGPHVSLFTTGRDVAGLLQRTGFTLITIDNDEVVINYPSITELMRDLGSMGESSCSYKRKLTLRRKTLEIAGDFYRKEYGNSDSTIPATYQLLNFIGWKPHPTQARPAERGSGKVSFKDLDKLDTISTDDMKQT